MGYSLPRLRQDKRLTVKRNGVMAMTADLGFLGVPHATFYAPARRARREPCLFQ